MGERRYEDVFIYVPSVGQILRIAEGNGMNLLEEDEAEGYVDYIYYDQYRLSVGIPECDGGQVMLTEMFREKFRSKSHTGSTGHGFWMCRSEVCDFRERQYHMQSISNEPKAAKKKTRN